MNHNVVRRMDVMTSGIPPSPGIAIPFGEQGDGGEIGTESISLAVMFGASGGVSIFPDAYLYRDSWSWATQDQGTVFASLALNRFRIQFDIETTIKFENDYGGLFFPDDVDEVRMEKLSLGSSYNMLPFEGYPGGVYAGIGISKLGVDQVLTDQVPFRGIDGHTYETEGDTTIRKYTFSETHHGADVTLSVISSIDLSDRWGGFWGFAAKGTFLFERIDGILDSYSATHYFIGLQIGLMFKNE